MQIDSKEEEKKKKKKMVIWGKIFALEEGKNDKMMSKHWETYFFCF